MGYGERVGGRDAAKLKVVGTLVVAKRYPPVFSIFFDSETHKGYSLKKLGSFLLKKNSIIF